MCSLVQIGNQKPNSGLVFLVLCENMHRGANEVFFLGRAQFPCFPFNMSKNSTSPARQYLRTIKGDMDLHTLSSQFPETQESGSVRGTQLGLSCTMSLVFYDM